MNSHQQPGPRTPDRTTPSFDVDQAKEMTAWLRDALTSTKILAERAEGGAVAWHIQPSDHQFVDLGSRLPGGTVLPVTYGGDEGAMLRRDAEHAARHHPQHEYAVADYHLGLLNLHALEETTISVHKGRGVKLVPYATCSYCDTGNPYEAPHMGYPCPTIRGLLHAHRFMPGYRPEWATPAPAPATPTRSTN